MGGNAKVLKELAEVIVDTIVHIINLCIGSAIWPDSLTCAENKPIFKDGDKSLSNNYRPLISNPAKIFEKIIFNRLFPFIQKQSFISTTIWFY